MVLKISCSERILVKLTFLRASQFFLSFHVKFWLSKVSLYTIWDSYFSLSTSYRHVEWYSSLISNINMEFSVGGRRGQKLSPPRGHLAMSGGSFGCHNLGEVATGI